MKNEFTAVFKKMPEGYIGFVEELRGTNAQSDSLEEAREILREAAMLVLESNRMLAEGGSWRDKTSSPSDPDSCSVKCVARIQPFERK